MADLARSGQVGSWLDKLRGSGMQKAGSHVAEGAHAIRQVGEAAITGAALGALRAQLTVTVIDACNNPLQDGLDYKDKFPIDLGLGAVAIIGGIAMPHVGADLRTVGSTALGIFAFRKTDKWMLSKKGVERGKGPTAVKTALKKGRARVRGEGDMGAEYDVGVNGDVGADDVGADPVVEAAKLL